MALPKTTTAALAGIPRGTNDETVSRAVRDAALAATDLSWLSRGETVFIKPVVNSGNRYPSTTGPLGIAAIVALLKERGAARVIVGDMSGVENLRFGPNGVTKGSTRALMERTGIARAALDAGAELHAFEEAGWNGFYEQAAPVGSHWKKPLMVPNILREIDHIILMPRCGRHVIAGATLGLKAAVGYMRHDTRLEYHHDAATLQEKTAEANFIPVLREKQRLVITLADKVLATFGPDHGHVETPGTGLVFASTSVVAHEMVSLAWLLENLKNVFAATRAATDLYRWPLTPQISNSIVVAMLGGVSKVPSAEHFSGNPIERIWDDRTLRRACELTGGAPPLKIIGANKEMPEEMLNRIKEAVSAEREQNGPPPVRG